MALLILCVTIVLLTMIFVGYSTWIVAIASMIIFTVLTLATVGKVDALSNVLAVILGGLVQIPIKKINKKDS